MARRYSAKLSVEGYKASHKQQRFRIIKAARQPYPHHPQPLHYRLRAQIVRQGHGDNLRQASRFRACQQSRCRLRRIALMPIIRGQMPADFKQRFRHLARRERNRLQQHSAVKRRIIRCFSRCNRQNCTRHGKRLTIKRQTVARLRRSRYFAIAQPVADFRSLVHGKQRGKIRFPERPQPQTRRKNLIHKRFLDYMRKNIGAAFYSNPPKASYCVAPLRRTKAYCLQRRALSETLGGRLYIHDPRYPVCKATQASA